MWAMALGKAEVARAVDGEDQAALQASAIKDLVADERAHTSGAQLGQRGGTHVAQKVAQCFVDGQGLLSGVGEPIDIGQHMGFQVAQLEVQLTAAAQLEAE